VSTGRNGLHDTMGLQEHKLIHRGDPQRRR
jgi:hypothetical protein